MTLVLHTWGSAMTHHPQVHGIVPGGGLSADGERWVACRPGFFLPVRVLLKMKRSRNVKVVLTLVTTRSQIRQPTFVPIAARQ